MPSLSASRLAERRGLAWAMLNSSLMALPYPHEVETGQLRPRAPEARRPFDMDEHMAQSVEARADELVAFGVTLRVPPGEDAQDVASRFRAALVDHFNERRPAADLATWDSFVSQARAQLERLEQADDHALHVLLITIDGL
jgi:hypothetical protein